VVPQPPRLCILNPLAGDLRTGQPACPAAVRLAVAAMLELVPHAQLVGDAAFDAGDGDGGCRAIGRGACRHVLGSIRQPLQNGNMLGYTCPMSNMIRETQRKSDVVPVTVLMAPSMRVELERLASEAERSLGGEVRLALREHLARADEREEQS
jgi:hypothetical protein